MTPGRRANEIRELVRRLGSRRPSVVDAARARLAIVGGRAVEALIESLDGDNNRVRSHAMPLLALIGDPRGREPLVAMLLDRDPRMREIAAQCLARFPCSMAVAALDRVLQREERDEIRVAAAQSLVEQYAAGREEAVCRLLELLSDPGESGRVRRAALTLLPLLRAGQRRSLLASLRTDPNKAVARRARKIERGASGERGGTSRAIRRAIADLGSNDYAVWNDAVHRLASRGSDGIEPLIDEMQRRAHDPEYCTRAGMALRALGPRRARGVADALERVNEPIPLGVLVDVVGALGEKSMIYRLKDLVDRVREIPAVSAGPDGLDMMQRVRAKAHLELARIGSRVAIQDVHEALADSDRRCELEMLAALELVGKREEIEPLLRVFVREDRFTRQRIGETVRAIMKRERIRRNNRMFRRLGPEQQRAFRSIFPERRRRAPGRRKATSSRTV